MSMDFSFLKEWSLITGRTVSELTTDLEKKITNLIQIGMSKDEAFEEARSILFIELKGDMQSPALPYDGIVCGATESFDWTIGRRKEATEKWQQLGDAAIGKYVTVVEVNGEKVIKPLFFNAKQEKMRQNVLEPSLIRTIYGFAIPHEKMSEILLLTVIINNKSAKTDKDNTEIKKEDYDCDYDKLIKLTEDEMKKKITENWSFLKFFQMTVSNKYADNKDEKYINVPELFKCYKFRAIDKTDKEPFYILNASSKTMFEDSKAITFNPNVFKRSPTYLKIANLNDAYSVSTAYSTRTSKDKTTQTTNDVYIVEGSASGDLVETPYSDIMKLDDLSLGFDTDKSVSMFLPKGSAKFGKNSRLIVCGTLTRAFNSTKKGYEYPSVQVSSIYILKLVKPIEIKKVVEKTVEIKPDIVSNDNTTKNDKPLEDKNQKVEDKKDKKKKKDDKTSIKDANNDEWSGGV